MIKYSEIKKITSLPLTTIWRKVIYKAKRSIKHLVQRFIDKKGLSRQQVKETIEYSYFDVKKINIDSLSLDTIQYLSQMYSDHRFDLLGSGWVCCGYDSGSLGVEGNRYNMNTKPPFVSHNYEPIDWQKDFKSGYRWSNKVWYKDIVYGNAVGADIKVPWELSRLQHLPQMAIFAVAAPDLKQKLIYEFKMQVYDFIINNSLRMGVNWVCAMDVGIRAANILVAYDLFLQIDEFHILDEPFKRMLEKSIYEHGIFIVDNFEYSGNSRNNHYLGNIVGLLFISAYLKETENSTQWLALSIQELLTEIDFQFYNDGGNFESSTSYHRLSGEMVIYAISLVLGLKSEKIISLQDYKPRRFHPEIKLTKLSEQKYSVYEGRIELHQSIINKIFRIGMFSVGISKPNGEVPQFGDNDSGRFLKFFPTGNLLDSIDAVKKYINLKGYPCTNEMFYDECILNHSAFISCFGGLFKSDIFKCDQALERTVIESLCSKQFVATTTNCKYPEVVYFDYSTFAYSHVIRFDFNLENEDIQFFCFSDSGIYVFKSENFYLSVCCTPIGQNGVSGHGHNDKLSFELQYMGVDLAKDPGTYLYTPIISERNKFRSTFVHNVIIVENMEQNLWSEELSGLFSLNNDSECFILEYSNRHLTVLLKYRNVFAVRKFKIDNNGLSITDECNKPFKYNKFSLYSSGYGKIEKI